MRLAELIQNRDPEMGPHQLAGAIVDIADQLSTQEEPNFFLMDYLVALGMCISQLARDSMIAYIAPRASFAAANSTSE